MINEYVVCDRCRKRIDDRNYHDVKLHRRKYFLSKDIRDMDLCEECYKELKEWLHKI